MAVPKCKVSKARRDKRRSSHWKISVPGVVKCPKCGAMRLPHRACKNCTGGEEGTAFLLVFL